MKTFCRHRTLGRLIGAIAAFGLVAAIASGCLFTAAGSGGDEATGDARGEPDTTTRDVLPDRGVDAADVAQDVSRDAEAIDGGDVGGREDVAEKLAAGTWMAVFDGQLGGSSEAGGLAALSFSEYPEVGMTIGGVFVGGTANLVRQSDHWRLTLQLEENDGNVCDRVHDEFGDQEEETCRRWIEVFDLESLGPMTLKGNIQLETIGEQPIKLRQAGAQNSVAFRPATPVYQAPPSGGDYGNTAHNLGSRVELNDPEISDFTVTNYNAYSVRGALYRMSTESEATNYWGVVLPNSATEELPTALVGGMIGQSAFGNEPDLVDTLSIPLMEEPSVSAGPTMEIVKVRKGVTL